MKTSVTNNRRHTAGEESVWAVAHRYNAVCMEK